MKCLNCQADNQPGARFCANCGAALVEASSPEKGPGMHWAYRFWLIWLAGLIGLGIVGGIIGVATTRGFGGGVFVLVGFGALAWLGSLIWIVTTGRLPGVQQKVPPLLRVAVAVLPLGINGLVGTLFFVLSSCDGEFLCSNKNFLLSFGIGILFFLVLTIGETLAFLTVWGVVYLARKSLRGRLNQSTSA